MLPQEESLKILVEFLEMHGYTKLDNKMTPNTIKQLATIVLEENTFVYGKKIYQQIIGGAMGSSFTLTLANIFMWKWQKKLVHQQAVSHEFYGRLVTILQVQNINSTFNIYVFLDMLMMFS